jgi:nucleoside-diphosphate-sugar epimerase
MHRINVALPRQLVTEAAKWPAKAIFIAGSGSEYDRSAFGQPVSECGPLEHHAPYGASKAAGTLRVISAAAAHDVPLAVGRIFGVYGPGEPRHRLLPTLFRHLSRNERVPLSSGTQLRDFLYIDDVIAATLALLAHVERTKIQLIANVASGEPVTVRSVAEMVAEELNVPRSLLGFGDISLRPDESKCFSGDPFRLTMLTGWHPTHDLRDGIRRSLAELRTRI